jgi:outer membrane protein
LASNTIITGWRLIGLKLVWLPLLLTYTVGCNHGLYGHQQGLTERILPPLDAGVYEDPLAPEKPGQGGVGGSQARLGPPTLTDDPQPQGAKGLAETREGGSVGNTAEKMLSLPEAIEIAFRQQPRLQVFFENVEQARRGREIAFAPFLPVALAGYSVGGFEVNVGGTSVPLGPGLPGFVYEPFLGAAPVGLRLDTGFELAELKLQWLVCDFGRRLGRYRQAGFAADIAQLQSERAFQTVANEVSVAYYQVLRARALRKSAGDTVRRAQDDLDVAKRLGKGGVLEKEKVLRAEVLLAESQRQLDATEGAEAVAAAALNLAIGINVNAPIRIAESSEIPPFGQSLADCLQTAAGLRREFQVARQSIQVADENRRVARADFAPRILAEGALIDLQQSAPRGHLDVPVGFIKLEWGLFEGGKRVAELRVSESKIRAAMAQAETIADTIAYQVTEAYRLLVTARLGIDRSRPAVTQAEENYRLVRARFKQGDATSADITDAESTLTRAQQNYLNSIHDYLIALVKLEYAMGVTPTPVGVSGHRFLGHERGT